MQNKTFAPNPDKVGKNWIHMDATDKVLGKLSTDIVKALMGKNKPEFAPNENIGDKVVVTNSAKVATTGTKMKKKMYYHHTGFPGGLRTESLENLMKRDSTEVIRKAVKGMLPKNKLQKERLANLYIYKGAEHPHKAQIKN